MVPDDTGQRTLLADIVVHEAGAKGLGVFARRAFAPGVFIFRRRHGQVVRTEDIPLLPVEDQRHLCELDWSTSAVLLPPGCYLNHACDPNAIRSGVNVYAWRAIQAGEELTIDYRLNAFDGERWECRCGGSTCAGWVINSFFALPPATQATYLRYAPQFIRAEYRRLSTRSRNASRSGSRVRL